MTADPFTELREALADLDFPDRLAVWLAAKAPELREPFDLGHELAAMIDTIARGRAADELDRAATEAEPWDAVGTDALHDRAAALRAQDADA